MKGFNMGVTTVYITEAIALECELWVAAELKYTPRLVEKNKETTERWDTQVENALYVPWADVITQMEETISQQDPLRPTLQNNRNKNKSKQMGPNQT